VKEVRLQTHKRQYELLQMEDSETVNDFFTKVTKLVNQIKNCGEVITTKAVVSKHYSIFDFRQRKFRQQLNNRSQKGFKQRFLRCCQGFTNSQISCTKSLPLCFGQRFNKRGHKNPLPLCFWQRYEKRGQKQLLPIDLCYGL
jgi:hypothetical protein